MQQTTHSINSSKNLLLVSNTKENNTETSNDTYTHLTSPENKSIRRPFDDTQNNSFNYNTSLNYNTNNLSNNSNNLSFNNSLIINSLNNTTANNNLLINNSFISNNNNNINNNSVLMSNTSNLNNSFSLNNNSTRNLLGNNNINTMNTSMNQLHQASINLNTSFNNSFNNNNAQAFQTTSSPNILKPIATAAAPISNINNNIYNNFNNSFNINTSSHNMKILNTMNTMDIPVTTSLNGSMNRGTSSPPVPPLAIGKDDSDFEEEKEKQIVVIVDPSTYNLPVNEVPVTVPDPRVIPNSVEDWIKYHAAIDPERNFLPPDEPPSKIPVLESTVPLDEVITPQRSVSCRIRLLQQQRRKKAQELAEQEKLLQQNNSKSLNNVMNNDAIVYSSPSIKVPAAVRSTKKIKSDNNNIRSGNNRYPSQKPTPRFQLCTYKKCEWIATNKCEKCSKLCCLDHSQRFYFFFPSLFTPKYYCPDCMRSVSNFWRYAYLVAGTIFVAVLIAGIIYNYKGKGMNNVIFPLFSIIMVSLVLSSYSLSYLSNQHTEKTKESERLLLD